MFRSIVLAQLVFVATSIAVPTTSGSPQDEQAIKSALAQFYEGWNAHDIDKMTAVYADDIDHINVLGEWHQGKTAIREDLARLHSSGRNIQKTYTIEKIRFVKPDVAVIQVRSLSTVCNIGTYVMTKQSGKWLVISFTNVNCPMTSASGEKS
jgi:uncharacterized protein (TIGR02246 family)